MGGGDEEQFDVFCESRKKKYFVVYVCGGMMVVDNGGGVEGDCFRL